ncbi:MAG: serine protease, partial [Planctomycetota bacterium]
MMRSQSARTRRGQGLLFLIASLIGVAVQANPCVADDLPGWSPALERIFAGKPPRDAADLLEMQSYLQAVSQKAIDATVSIRYGLAHGSGVIVSENGMILTAAHVISPRNQRALVRLSDGRQVRAKPLGRHLALDACMLKLEGEGPWP